MQLYIKINIKLPLSIQMYHFINLELIILEGLLTSPLFDCDYELVPNTANSFVY